MRKFVLATIFAGIVAGGAFADESPSPVLSDDEKTELLQMLDDSREKLRGLIEGLSDEQWNFKQNPDRWSVGQCAEHIVRSERALLESAKAAMAGDPDPDWYERTKDKNQLIRNVMPNRRPMGQGGAIAPQEIRPKENWNQARALEELEKIRTEVRQYVDSLSGPVKDHTYEHPFPVFNWLNAYDWLIYIPTHTIRHSKQIIEVQEDANYPKS